MPTGTNNMSHPTKVTPVCFERIDISRRFPVTSLDCRTEPAPRRAARTLEVPIEPDSRRFADQIVLGHEAPHPPVLAVVPVVAHHEVAALRHGRLENRSFADHGISCRAAGIVPTAVV